MNEIMETCLLCGKRFQMGPHRYDGKLIAGYKMLVCQSCYSGNWDGWAPYYEDRIIKHLEEMQLPTPDRNDKGLLPRD